MIKAVIFDLDGVLVDADLWHFESLNRALDCIGFKPISWQEHLEIYKGIPTMKKLEILTQRKGLPKELWDKIYQKKQFFTIDAIKQLCKPDPEKIDMLKRLKNERFTIAVCSNAIRNSVDLMLEKSGLHQYVDISLSNQDVSNPKPNPEIYLKCFKKLNLSPEECLIVEDAPRGRESAIASDAFTCFVDSYEEVNYYRIWSSIKKSEKINVVIPAAGSGKRFWEVGYFYPKPLVWVIDRPMIAWVLKDFEYMKGLSFIFIVQSAHERKYHIGEIFSNYTYSHDVSILTLDYITEGAACTVLLAENLINNNQELIIANSDQFVSGKVLFFLLEMIRLKADGGMITFQDNDPKWSYAEVDLNNKVLKVAEKEVLKGNHATAGIYYYRRGKDFVKYAKQMIRKNIRVNNEFYVCPVFNEFIEDGKNIYIFEIEKDSMHGMGTPEDLKIFEKRIGRRNL